MIKNINLNGFTKNIFKLSFGTIFGQGISLITLPIFTRIYGAEIIGQWALITSMSSIINSFSDLGLINSIMIEENEVKALKIYKVISTISFIICFISATVYFLYSYLTSKTYIGYILIISIILFIWAFTMQQIQVCYTWLNRKKKYDILMKNPIINNLVLAIFAIGLGVLGFRSFGYFIGMLLGQIITLIHMKLYLPRKMFSFNVAEYRYTLKKHKKFVLYQLPSTIILQFKAQLPTILFGSFFGKKMLGYYSVSMRLLTVPISLLANSIGKVYFQRVSELKNNIKEIGKFTLKSLNASMKVSYLPIIGMLVLSDVLFIAFFGDEYKIAGDFTRIMTFYGFFLFLSMSVSGVSIVINKQYFMLLSGLAQVFGIFISFTLGYIFDSIYVCLFIHSMLFIIVQIVYFCSVFKCTKIKMKEYILPLIKYVLIVIILSFLIRVFLLKIGIVQSI